MATRLAARTLNLTASLSFNRGVYGTDGTWEHNGGKGLHGRATYRLNPDARRGLRAWMEEAQDFTCAEHGGTCTTDAADFVFCHYLPRGNRWVFDAVKGDMVLEPITKGAEGKGWAPANIFLACNAANMGHRARGGEADYTTMARPDLIMLEWPSIPTLTRLGKSLRP